MFVIDLCCLQFYFIDCDILLICTVMFYLTLM